MFKRFTQRDTQRSSQRRNSLRRRNRRIRVESLETRRLFAADAFSVDVAPPPPADGPTEVAAEVSDTGNVHPDETPTINFAKIRYSGMSRGGAGNDTLLGNRGNDIVLGQDGNDLLIFGDGDGGVAWSGSTGGDDTP